MRLGFYAARSHRVVPIEHCPVTIERLDAAIRELVKLAAEQPQLFGGVRHVVARASVTDRQLVISFNSERPNKALSAAVDIVRARIQAMTGLVTNWEPASENAVFGKRFATLWGSPLTTEHVAGASLTFGAASFFQINTPVLEAIARHLEAALAGARRVVDLYCGVGTFGVILGKRGIASTGVEALKDAVEEAAANAAANGVTCAAFEHASAAQAVAGERGRTLFAGADAVIVDPPRRGCDPEVIAAIVNHRPARVEYVSCNPATLARDAKMLVAAGYRLRSVAPFDMFPQTGHIEVLAEFEL
jgi:23S rRNA (uracil1939-C5)-methyltransferase